MARRGTASRGSSRSSAFSRSPSPSARRPAPPQPPKQTAVARPAPTAPAAAAPAAAPGGGLLGQVASTAAGVAIGHTVGHAITGAFMGGSGNHEAAPVDQQNDQQQPYYNQSNQQGNDPCRAQLEEFINCAQNQTNDLTLCDSFNQILKDCRVRYGANMH